MTSHAAASGDVCRVPLDDPVNAPAVAAAFGGTYHESDCGFLQKCSSVHIQYTSRGADISLATWYTCELDAWQAGLLAAALVAVALAVFFAVRRARRHDEGALEAPRETRERGRV
jgi:hypothetical protein